MSGLLGWGFAGVSTIARQYMFDAVTADPRSRVTAVMSSSPQRAEDFAAERQVPAACGTLDQLLDLPDVDVVYISTTNDRHYQQALATAAAGKHLLCEKPLALTVADAVDMRAASAAAGVTMGTNHHLRHAPTIRAMRRLVEQGAIGTPLAARVFHAVQLPDHLQTWRVNSKQSGGGVALDITVHDCDTLRYLLAREIAEVTAFTANQGLASEDVADAVMGVMRFANGVLASFHDAFTVPHAGTGLELHGSDGSLIGRDVMTQQPKGDVYLRRNDTTEHIDIGPREGLYRRAVRKFNDAALNHSTPSASAADGVISLQVALAAAQSAATGQAVRVGNPFDPAA
jgi:1,5-anhydro-D-fructose reductase (1,5-anhydro-D-mannitol-forming)